MCDKLDTSNGLLNFLFNAFTATKELRKGETTGAIPLRAFIDFHQKVGQLYKERYSRDYYMDISYKKLVALSLRPDSYFRIEEEERVDGKVITTTAYFFCYTPEFLHDYINPEIPKKLCEAFVSAAQELKLTDLATVKPIHAGVA